jgi:phosphatidylglycerophosphatase A
MFGSALFSGYSPLASGTVGSMVALVIYFIPGCEQWFILLPLILIVFFLGIPAAARMEKFYGKDPAEVTIDEVVGMWISLLWLPKTIPIAMIAFIAFRLFDIVKPFPANYYDKRTGGFAIMMDDVVAGFYANVIIQIMLKLNLLSLPN